MAETRYLWTRPLSGRPPRQALGQSARHGPARPSWASRGVFTVLASPFLTPLPTVGKDRGLGGGGGDGYQTQVSSVLEAGRQGEQGMGPPGQWGKANQEAGAAEPHRTMATGAGGALRFSGECLL